MMLVQVAKTEMVMTGAEGERVVFAALAETRKVIA